MGQTALLPLRKKASWGFFFVLKNPTASVGFEPANLGTKGQHATSRPPKPLLICICSHVLTKIICYNNSFVFFFLWLFDPIPGCDLPITHIGHTTLSRTPPGRMISPTQKSLPDNTQRSQEINILAPRRDSNPQSQQVSGRRPMPIILSSDFIYESSLLLQRTGCGPFLFPYWKVSCFSLYEVLIELKHKRSQFVLLNIKLTRVRPTPQIGCRVFVRFGTALAKEGVRKWKFWEVSP